ncbi:MAG TPA: acetoacetate--CoA ligase, partial [Chloroflexota bacterium]|nr:acetoacetate--CoA ligase [Chloroflexota bacterium]
MARQAASVVSANPPVVWQPREERVAAANLTRYAGWLRETRGLTFSSYEELWRWSVDELEGFWGSTWEYFDVT